MTEYNPYAVTSGNKSIYDAIITLKEQPCEAICDGFYLPGGKNCTAVTCSDAEFIGRFEILYTAYGKMKFAIASFCGMVKRKETSMMVREPEEADINMVEIETAVHAVKQGMSVYAEQDRNGTCGAVKAETDGLLQSFLASHGITLKEFLGNPKYIVVINDYNGTFEALKELGILNMDTVEEEYRG